MASTSASTAHEGQVTVKLPADLYQEINRLATSENWSQGHALVLLARLGANKIDSETMVHAVFAPDSIA